MKKLLSVILSLMLLGSVALADQYDEFVKDQYDFENANDAQLEGYIKMGEALIRNAQAELDRRNEADESSESSADLDTSVHKMDGIEYSLVKAEKGEYRGQNIIKIYIDWKNTGDEPTSILFSNFMIDGYQSGKEVDRVYTSDDGTDENYMPGYGGIVYYAFEKPDDSEMTFFIRESFTLDDNNNWSFTLDPQSLSE